MPTPDRSKLSPFRRVERAIMGLIMAVMALFIEKIVMRSVKKSGTKTPAPAVTPLKGNGGQIEHQG